MAESNARIEGVADRLKVINWFGIATGVLMLVLPFLGAWWQATVGTGALHLEFSPFYYHVTILGHSITSSLVGFFILAAKLIAIIGGGLMIAGSLATDRWWGKKLMRFGAMKVFWFVVMLIGLLLIGTFLANNYLSGLLSNIGGGGASGASIQLDVPYVVGTSTSTIQAQNATISASINASLTFEFVIAVVTAGLGIATRIYHGKLVDKLDVDVD